MKGQQDNLSDAYDAFRLLNDTDQGVFSDLYGSWAGTIHTSAYLPKDMKAWIALGGNQDPTQFDFAKWLDGQDVEIERIIGEVDTDIPFVHMDKGQIGFKISVISLLYEKNIASRFNRLLA